MDGQTQKVYQEWAAEQWAGVDPSKTRNTDVRWTGDQWVGDQGGGERRHRVTVSELIEGQHGLSGYGHTVPAAHWAPGH
jgi:hypothetical protein